MTTEEAKNILLSHRPDRPRKTEDRRLQTAIDTVLNALELYMKAFDSSDITVGGLSDKTKYSGCFKCPFHINCVDAFKPHAVYCNEYKKEISYDNRADT